MKKTLITICIVALCNIFVFAQEEEVSVEEDFETAVETSVRESEIDVKTASLR